MGRTINPDEVAHGSHRAMEQSRFGQVKFPRPREGNHVLVSKALSRLLRHQAENFGVPITKDGWVRLDHVLAWKGLNGRDPKARPVTIEDVFAAVEDNDKKRFALKLVDDEQGDLGKVKAEDVGVNREEIEGQPEATVDEVVVGRSSKGGGKPSSDHSEGIIENASTSNSGALGQPPLQQPSYPIREAAHAKVDSESARVIAHWRNSAVPPPASNFMIRATQGHSIKTIAADTGLLTPITLSESSTIPSTCVHGTFYGAWLTILKSGGLKRMGRNHVHFAEGPSLAELGYDETGARTADVITERKEVISGMRRDAELLIYVDVTKALDSEKDLEWWRSENGVILTEGTMVQDENTSNDVQENSTEASVQTQPPEPSDIDQVTEAAEEIQVKEKDQRNQKSNRPQKGKYAQAAAQEDKMVPTKYWIAVVDAKGGRGVIWRQGEGVVQELPERLTSKGTPKGRGRGGGRGGSRGRGK